MSTLHLHFLLVLVSFQGFPWTRFLPSPQMPAPVMLSLLLLSPSSLPPTCLQHSVCLSLTCSLQFPSLQPPTSSPSLPRRYFQLPHPRDIYATLFGPSLVSSLSEASYISFLSCASKEMYSDISLVQKRAARVVVNTMALQHDVVIHDVLNHIQSSPGTYVAHGPQAGNTYNFQSVHQLQHTLNFVVYL